LGLKDQACLYRTCFLPGSAQKAITAFIFNNWLWKGRQDVLQASFLTIFHTSGLLSPPESEIRAGKLLVDPGHLQEELKVGRHHQRYIKACCRCPKKHTYC
jgi:hypothetical protein